MSSTGSPVNERNLRSSTRTSTRNPRRRPRQSDGESVRTAPRRKRSKINEDTFIPPRTEEEEEVNGSIEVADMNGSIETPSVATSSPKRGRGRPRKERAPIFDVDIPMRVKKPSVKRPTKSDGATVLTQNARYSIRELPSTPKDLRREGVEFRGSLGAGHHALAVTRERAYVWDYTSHGPVNNPKSFDVPFTVKLTDILPFGALIATGSSTELGMVLISASSGKVVYYESIERAASLGLFQERNLGIEGSLGTLFSGEVVTDLIPAQYAGLIVTLSSGRIAQVMLRDAQGKARVSAQFLRATDQSSGGFFGSIKGLIGGGGWKRDVVGVHTRPLGSRGQVQAISLTERVELQSWDLDWNGQYRFRSTVDFKEVISKELRRTDIPELQGKEENVTALDFCILQPSSNSTTIATVGTELPLEALLLLRIGTPSNSDYVLAGISIEGQDVLVPQVLQLSTYRRVTSQIARGKPRLLLPGPQHTALVVFDDAIVVKEMDYSDANSPEAQLHASYIPPSNFEHVAYIRQDRDVAILGACEEDERGSQESAALFIKGAGLVRVSVVDPKTTDQDDKISIKNQIEQAVFHGALQDGNFIDFSRRADNSYTPEEVEQAALVISDEILRSTSPFISTNPTSMDAHLAYKGQALRALIAYTRQNFTTLSQRAVWQLLWDAEKVAAAQAIWRAFEDHVATSSQTKRTATILDEACAMVSRETASSDEKVVSEDLVLNFFICKLHRLDTLLYRIQQVLAELKDDIEKTPQVRTRLVSQGDEIWYKSLEAAFSFRNDNAAAYGILPEFIEEGVLTDVAEYAELPEFWTSTEQILKDIGKLAQLSREVARAEYENAEDEATTKLLEPDIMKVNQANPRLVQLLCQIYQERINWLASRESQKDRRLADMLRTNYVNERYDHFRALADIAQAEAGFKLAEKYKDMNTLTEMVLAELQFAEDQMLSSQTVVERSNIRKWTDAITVRIGKYFDQFGDDWANAYFDFCFAGKRAGDMLKTAQEKWQGPLTKYLRADSSRAKLCWINDITADADFVHAGESLISTATDRETKLWSKKVELSMGMLSLLASQEDMRSKIDSTAGEHKATSVAQGELDVVAIQEQLYGHIFQEVKDCIDHQAKVEVAMQKMARKIQDLPSLRQLLETYLDRVLDHDMLSSDELIDTLSLLDTVVRTPLDVHNNLQGQEFYLALKALNAIALEIPQDRLDILQQLIWKRCYIYDDWVDITNQTKRSNNEVADRLKQTAAWRTLRHGLEGGFFDTARVGHLLPSACLGAGCKTEDLRYRWANQDLLDPVLHDNRIQDEQLESYVTDRKLDQWIEECVKDVKATLEKDAEMKSQALEIERNFDKSVLQVPVNAIGINGYPSSGVLELENDEGGENRELDDASAEMIDIE